ncbi:MAG: TonB-dependent receptor [Bacteroidaceae bacterium]
MKHLVFLLSLMLPLIVSAQTINVKGVIVDTSNEPIIGASLLEDGTTNGTITDLDGKFALNVQSKGKLTISYIGYKTQTITVETNHFLKIVLVENTEMIDEVVVTGYGGKQLRTKVTNSIAKVSGETLQKGLFSNPAQALSGAVAGLSVSQTSGNPGSTPTIVLRGGTDFNGSGSPLILIDGQARSSMSDINPEDIESMEVLKDAGATAIYGARANNGVILITTKKGKVGKSEVTFKAKLGVNSFNNMYDFMNARDYIYWMRMSYQNVQYSENGTHPDGSAIQNPTGLAALGSATPFGTGNKYYASDGITPLDGNVNSQAIWSTMKYSDDLAFLLKQGWETMTDPVYGDKLIFKQSRMEDFNISTPSYSQDYNLGLSGGNDKGSYYASLGYNRGEGNAVNNWYQRLSFTVNADYKLKPWLTSISNFNFTEAKWYGLSPTQSNESNYFSRALSVPSAFRGYNANGEMLLGPNSGDGNQLYNIDKFTRDNNNRKLTMGQAFVFDIIDGLNFKVSANWYYVDLKQESFNKDYLSRPGQFDRSRNSSAETSQDLNQTYNAVLNYDKQITKDHYVSAMLGFEYYDSYTKGFNASGSGAPTDDFQDLGFTSTDEGKRSIDSWHYGNRIMSFFGRVNYDYQSKYLLSFVMRKDGYSKLATDNRWGVFPGISAGWVFGKEKFMDDFKDVVSFAKLRMSYGVNGNVNPNFVGNYTVQGSYGSNKYGGNVGFLLGGIPNPYLTWETSNTTEFGLDLSFIENRINTNITYYIRNTYDKFANITVPTTSGVTSVVSNNGEIRNQGLELETSFKIINKGDWRLNLGWNTAYNRNEVIKLPDNGLFNNRQNGFEVYTGKKLEGGDYEKIWVGGYQEGQRPGDIYLFKSKGLFRTQADLDKYSGRIDVTSGNNGANGRALYIGEEGYNKLSDGQKKNSLPIGLGDVIWEDVNGDGTIDNYDMVKVGNSVPKWTGGFNTQVSWKALTLSARFDYALGFKVMDNRTPWIMGNMQGTYNSINDSKDTWSSQNVDATYPTYVWADQLGKRNYARSTSMFCYDGDYLSIREVALNYQLPDVYVKKMGMKRVDFSVTAQNLGYITEGKHIFSPEQTNNWGGYPLPRSVIFGLSVSF